MEDLHELAVHLRTLGEEAPTPERRAEVTAALAHKREGIQSVAAQVLGRWGGGESVEALRTWLRECERRKYGWSVRGVAVRELTKWVGAQDAGWVLQLYFGAPDQLSKHELLPLVLALPAEAARERLVAGLHDPAWANRQAAVKVIGNMPYADRRALLRPLVDDPDHEVQKSARFLSQEA